MHTFWVARHHTVQFEGKLGLVSFRLPIGNVHEPIYCQYDHDWAILRLKAVVCQGLMKDEQVK